MKLILNQYNLSTFLWACTFGYVSPLKMKGTTTKAEALINTMNSQMDENNYYALDKGL